ncbi:MAG: hypothetical protein M1348_02440 [Candidatus Parvarchaeota archaeon]|jgi:hypothetical protein|nr:hypothetical protein [Candidatus Parvarchaeota archaeon]
MESTYRFLNIKKEVDFGSYHVKYTKKELKERREGAQPADINKESIKVLKSGAKVKLRKKEKLALMEDVKADNIDKMHELLESLKS